VKNKKSNFRILDHTADLRVKIRGNSQKELFKNAARGMFSVITQINKITPNQSIPIKLKAQREEDLLVDWLNELIYLMSTRDILFCDFKIDEISPEHIKAEALGEKFNNKKHRINSEIKAATYHNLKIDSHRQSQSVEVIFDV